MSIASIQVSTQRIRAVPENKPFHPYGAALELMTSHAPELMVSGPAGTGKSRAWLEKLHLCARKYPGMRGAIARKTRRSITQSAMVTFQQKVLTKSSGVVFHGGDMEYRYPNGSKIIVGGLDKTSRLMSTEFDLIYVMEARELTLADWEDLTTRNRWGVMPYQQLGGDTNPDSPNHWILKRVEEQRLEMLYSHHTENPALYNQETQEWTAAGRAYLERLNNLTGVRKQRFLLGLWSQAEGLVYPEFSLERHWVARYDIPAWWRRWRVVDFGYTKDHPFVCQWWAQAPNGQLIMYREMYGVHRLVADWGKLIHAASRGEQYSALITDHDAEDRATLEAVLGVRTTPANKRVKMGIEAMKARLSGMNGTGTENGVPGMVFFQDALYHIDPVLEAEKLPTSTVEEFPSYVWAKRPDNTTTDEPVKRFDHGLDAARYMVMHLDAGNADTMSDAMAVLEEMLND